MYPCKLYEGGGWFVFFNKIEKAKEKKNIIFMNRYNKGKLE